WCYFFRRQRHGFGRLQQVHSVPAASGMRVFGERKRFRGARESFAGHKPVESGDGESEPGFTRGKVRRWRPSARVSDFVRAMRFAARARSGARPGGYFTWEISGVAQAARDSRDCGCSTKLFVPCKILKPTGGPV